MKAYDFADQGGYAEGGGGFNNAVSRLRTLELISGKQGLRIADEKLSREAGPQPG